MASGKLGSVAPAATTNTTIFQATAGKVTTFSVSIVNTAITAISFNLSIGATATPAAGDRIEYQVSLAPNDTYERTGLVASAAEYVVIYATAIGLEVRAMGFEQTP